MTWMPGLNETGEMNGMSERVYAECPSDWRIADWCSDPSLHYMAAIPERSGGREQKAGEGWRSSQFCQGCPAVLAHRPTWGVCRRCVPRVPVPRSCWPQVAKGTQTVWQLAHWSFWISWAEYCLWEEIIPIKYVGATQLVCFGLWFTTGVGNLEKRQRGLEINDAVAPACPPR